MKIELVKGFKDFTGIEAEKREEIRKILIDTFENYGFQPIETPLIEYEEFVKGLENPKDSKDEQDEAISDIFRLNDKGKRELALRYEFTFQLKRLMKDKKLPYKRYQIGYVFRDEPVSSNRVRQITQCDIDTIGSTVKDEAEILKITKEVLDKLGIKFVIYFNNRKLLNEILAQYGVQGSNITKVLREIDKLDKIPENEIKRTLKKYKAENIIDVLKNKRIFFKQFSSYKEIEELEEFCRIYNIKIEFTPTLARGLSYYDGTVFEVKTKEIRETICGGGSYTFNNVKCTGISFGLERLSSLSKVKSEKEKFLVVSLGRDKEIIRLAEKLRKKGKNTMIYYGKPSKALEYANSYNFNKVIFIGEKEAKSKNFKIKDMKTGRESLLKF